MTKKIYFVSYFLIFASILELAPNFISIYYSNTFEVGNIFIFLPIILSILILYILKNPHKILSILVFILYAGYIYLPFRISGKINHAHSTLIYASIFLAFIDLDQSLKSTKNIFILRLMQFAILNTYFSAGLWKLRALIESNFSASFFNAPLSYIAHSYIEGNHISIFILNLLLNSNFQLFIKIGFIFVIIFQLSTLLPVLKPSLIRYYGFLSLVFHLSTGITLGIYFFWMAFVSFIFLTLAEQKTP
jgi:hypothetical protein